MKEENKTKTRLSLMFIAVVAIILIVAVSTVVILEYFIIQTRLLSKEQVEESGLLYIILFGVASVFTGIMLTIIFSRVVLRPLDTLLSGMSRLSDGHYNVRIHLKKNQWFSSLSKGFNNLASELQNTEILRSDFVNNFSHELKTPIVSVSGLISLMKNEDLPKEKQKIYLEIIEEEINRLADMTTNMLNLSKIEKQEIITDKTVYNVSEQIRKCVLLLEKKWARKNIQLSLDFDEYNVCANKDLLKQVWFNILDNAVKFSPENGEITLSIEEKDDDLLVKISNQGQEISQEESNKIFNKFYRGNNTQSKEGNGIGLSIVKKIIDLHQGKVWAESNNGLVTFTILLKNN